MQSKPLNAFRESLPTHPHLELYDFWCSKADGGRLPARSSIDPLEIPKFLKYLVIAALEGPEKRVFFRLVGTEMASFWCEDFTGKYIDEVMEGAYLQNIQSLFHNCAAERAPLFSKGMFRWDQGRVVPTARLMLPLRGEGDDVGFVLVCQSFDLTDLPNNEDMRVLGPPVSAELESWKLA